MRAMEKAERSLEAAAVRRRPERMFLNSHLAAQRKQFTATTTAAAAAGATQTMGVS